MRSGNELGALTKRVAPVHSWLDIVLPPEALDQWHEIYRRVTRQLQVHEDWGFARKLSGGKGSSYGQSTTQAKRS